jgi:DUF971 family protein
MASTPTHILVNKTTGTGMEIEWADGHHSTYGFQYLRDACPCATCDDERDKTGTDFGEPPKPKGALPMFREPARPVEVTPVGKYAISFRWNDGHRTGIYSWEFLRMVCPCAECRSKRSTEHDVGSGGTL